MVVVLCVAKITAQNSLSGKITTTENNQPIPATIYLPQLEKGAAADLDGNYTIKNIPDGNYTVVFSSVGFATISEKVQFSGNKNIPKNMQLSQSAVEMEAVILSTPFHKLQSDNVMKVERVTTDDLKSQGATTLADGITKIAGVEIITTGGGIGKPVIRGLSSNRVLVYTQGVRLENQQFGDEHGLGINEAGIESVEVIKGPASLLYGSDALGGVLYINPEKFAQAGDVNGDVESTYYSNTLATATTVGVKTSGEKFKFLARGAYAAYSDYKTGDDYRVTNSRFNEKDFKTGVQYQGNKLKSTLRYNYNRSNIGIPEEIGDQNRNKDLEIPFQEIDNNVLSLENNIYFKNSSLDIKGGYLYNDRREYGENAETPSLRLKLNTFNYDVKYNLPQFGKFETIAGIQGMFQNNENAAEEILIPNAKTVDFGIFGTTHYHLEKVDFQAGLRFDTRSIESESARNSANADFIPKLSKDYTSFTAAVGAKLDFTDQLSSRLNLASGFRAPNLAELTSNGVHEGTNRYEVGNAALTNEQNFQADASLEFRNQHVEAYANGFYNGVSNYIFLTPTNAEIDGNQVFNYLQNNAFLYGGEFGFHLHPHPLDWLHFESSFETVTGQLKDGGYLPLIPANTLKNTFRVEFNDGNLLKRSYAFVAYENTFKQNNVSTFETNTAGYNLVNLGIGTSLDVKPIVFNFGINVTNLTNESYIAHLSRLKVDNIFNIGRSINVNLKMAF